ncbi:hypothetical protein [Thermomonas mangrovi]|uniref:hypothetical protein n=1 Tax=Thermomonas mangrovi TaxID=2993316 RepID=UPI0023071662|nr:hypothetical protein [Thermomonas mangrovi]
MSRARQDFLQRFATFEQTLGEATVQDGALHETDRNAKARLLRNGLAVASFAFLEDFIRQRSGEVLANIAASGVPFSVLPDKVRSATTFGLLRSLESRMKFEPDDAAKISFVQNHAGFVASTTTMPFQLSELSFGYKSSNISEDEVADILRAFRVQGPWQAVGFLASRVGLGSLVLMEAFKNAAKRRHMAAHVAGATTPLNDLENYVREAKAIAFGFDVLLSAPALQIRRRDVSYLGGGVLDPAKIPIHLLYQERGRFKERVFGSGRARATAPDVAGIEVVAYPRAIASGAAIAYLNPSGQLEKWDFPAL